MRQFWTADSIPDADEVHDFSWKLLISLMYGNLSSNCPDAWEAADQSKEGLHYVTAGICSSVNNKSKSYQEIFLYGSKIIIKVQIYTFW